MTDKEKIVLSVSASLATIAIGYLIWRHEEKVHAANDAAQVQANAEVAAQQNAQLESFLTAIPGYAQVSPTDTSSENFGSTSTAISPTDNNLSAILQAFYPSQAVQNPGASPAPTGDNQTTPATQPAGPNGTPVAIVKTLPARAPVSVSNLPQQLLGTATYPTS